MDISTGNKVPRTPVYAHGTMSPPPSNKSTLFSQNLTGHTSRPFSSIDSTSPRNQVVPFQPFVETPEQIPAAVDYPVPSSQSSQTFEGADALTQEEIRILMHMRMRQANAQAKAQAYQQQREQQMPPNAIPQGAGFYSQPHHNSRYGTHESYTTIDQPFGLPGKQSQMPSNEGHTYGIIKAKGNTKVILGNVNDGGRPVPWLNRKNNYAGGDLDGDAIIAVGDMTHEAMEKFLRPHNY